jgi:hypothetical protein
MLDHMYLHETDNPDVPPPPLVLRELVAKTIEPDVKRRKRDLQTATGLLLETSRTIERELFLVEPGAFDDLEPSDFEGDLDLREELPDLYGDEPPNDMPEDPFAPPGGRFY